MNIFKKEIKKGTKTIFVDKTDKEIIEEIHESFYTEVDRLLEFANIKKVEEPINEKVVEKSSLLHKLGFKKSAAHRIAAQEALKNQDVDSINWKKEKLKEAILYFQQKYPQYKFITEESVNKICETYGLVYTSVDKFIGDVPEKNAVQIKNFKIDDSDKLKGYFEIEIKQREIDFVDRNNVMSNHDMYMARHMGTIEYDVSKRFVTAKEQPDIFDEALRLLSRVNDWQARQEIRDISNDCYKLMNAPLEIAAPIKDFDMKDLKQEGNKLVEQKVVREIKDPVVLQPVTYKGEKHYLVVTAWGDEASDELVVNQKMN